MAKENMSQVCELEFERPEGVKRRMLTFSPSDFTTLQRWLGVQTPQDMSVTITALAKKTLSGEVVISKAEVETPTDTPPTE